MTDLIKFETRSAFETEALRIAVDELVHCDDLDWTIADWFEEASPEFIVCMEQAGKGLEERISERYCDEVLIHLLLTEDEATFLRAAFERCAEMTGNYTGAWGPNVESFLPHLPLEHYNAVEEACWSMAERLPEETWR